MHVLAIPNAPVHPDFYLDGFAQATHRFCRMMKASGHTVYLYAAEGSNAPCDEMIPIITEHERVRLLKDGNGLFCDYAQVAMDERFPLFHRSNGAAAAEVAIRKKEGDLLLTIAGAAQKPVYDFHPDLLPIEYSIGYTGNFTAYRVFESHAWQHYCYGAQAIVDGRFFDAVIPLFFDPDEFQFGEKHGDYLFYVGRLTWRKGVNIACQVAAASGVKLIIAGHAGQDKEGQEVLKMIQDRGHQYIGVVDTKTRNEMMSKARAVLTPTTYLEPFNSVAVEAQLTGTPVISTDWGGFTETIEQGKTGFRCAYLGEFVRAVEAVQGLDRTYILRRAISNYSMHNVRLDYDRYFHRISLLFGRGWNALD
jgi:glycosyltransferase involved in cell wall biosynthesis